MKVLFIDVDGVLNSSRSTLARSGERLFTDAQTEAFNRLRERWSEDGTGDKLPYGPQYTIDTIDPVAIDLIRRLLRKEPELMLVLSTSHRSFFCGSNYDDIVYGSEEHLHWLGIYFTALGLPSDRILGITDRLYCERGKEVQKWLEDHSEEFNVTHHLALDDGADFKPHQCEHLLIDPQDGFSTANFFETSKRLVIHESAIVF